MEKIIEAIYDLVGEEQRKGENSPSQRVKTIMQKLDKDNNGYLNEQEFVDGCLSDPVLRSLLAPNAWFNILLILAIYTHISIYLSLI